jgi:hypothetical protein
MLVFALNFKSFIFIILTKYTEIIWEPATNWSATQAEVVHCWHHVRTHGTIDTLIAYTPYKYNFLKLEHPSVQHIFLAPPLSSPFPLKKLFNLRV